MIKINPGVSIKALSPQMAVALMVAEQAFEAYDTDVVVTSGDDGQHSRTSLHYSGNALDLRTYTLPSKDAADDVAATMNEALGRDYDVLNEGTHIHVEYQPKRPVLR